MDLTVLRRIADEHVPERMVIDEGRVRELRTGWLFPFRSANGELIGGSQGIIVNKATGKVFHLGSAYPIERDVALYALGYCFDSYDLVVTAVRDMNSTVATLEKIGIDVVEPTYEHGTVWRIPRPLTKNELRARLAHLPCVFGDVGLYHRCEELERARASRAFTFELLEYRPVR